MFGGLYMSNYHPFESLPGTFINLDSDSCFLEMHQRRLQEKMAQITVDCDAITNELTARRLGEIMIESNND